MNTGTSFCLMLGIVFFVFGIAFAVLKEKRAILISGFNLLPKKEQEKYDKAAMSIDMRNSFLLWTILYLIGAVLSCFISSYIAVIVFIIWIILFLKDVHFDIEKAFSKYRL